MAHNSSIRAIGDWDPNTAVTPDEFDTLDHRLFNAVNADDGGCWAPSSAIALLGAQTVTISGRSIFSRLHSLTAAASSTWTITAGSTLTFGGTVTRQNLSSFVFASGSIAVWTAGSTSVHQSGSNSTFNSGSTLTFGAGHTITGTPTFDTNFDPVFGSGATVTVGANASWTNNGTWTSTAGTVQIKGHLVFGASATITRTVAQIASTPTGWTAWRYGGQTADSNASYDVSADSYSVPALSATRTYTLLHTSGTIPTAGTRLKFVGLRGTNGVVIQREDTTAIFTSTAPPWWAEFCFYGGVWNLIGWSETDPTGGTPLRFATLD